VKIHWNKPTEKLTAVAVLTRWESDQIPFAVVKVKSLLGMNGRWLAVRRMKNGNEVVVSRHRKRSAAGAACVAEANRLAGLRRKRTRWTVER